eukprot:5100792-Alexandrium_andersonii.AAC.1
MVRVEMRSARGPRDRCSANALEECGDVEDVGLCKVVGVGGGVGELGHVSGNGCGGDAGHELAKECVRSGCQSHSCLRVGSYATFVLVFWWRGGAQG